MSIELFWLTATIIMTGLFWLPYVIDRMLVRGPVVAMGNPRPDDKPQSAWAQRAMNAHKNGVENLVLFVPLVLMIHQLGLSSPGTKTAVAIYFFARLGHFLIFTAGVPFLRTIAFAVGWFAQAYLALRLIGLA